MNIKLITCIVVLFSLGCTVDTKPLPKWKVNLVRPDGYIQKQYIIRSELEPRYRPRITGHTELYIDLGVGKIKRFQSTDLFAPTGWYWESEIIKGKDNDYKN